MAFGSFDNKPGTTPMAEINMVPLIDVMLVLLVIFIVTAPLLTHAVKLELPRAEAHPDQNPNKVDFAIDATGALFWDGVPVDRPEAQQRFAQAARQNPQPEIHLRADKSAAYRFVAETLADASRAGLSKVGFVSLPEQ
ncbi:MAG: biopolymer transporter ExbD [Betaproteobacteria bacterium]|nr:biopolymer transporter ExbD [Betaproteobacteria bacterium]